MIFKDFDLKKLFQLMQEHDVSELSFKDGKTEIAIKRTGEPVFASAGMPAKEVPPAGTQTAAPGAEEKEAEATSKPGIPADNYYAVIAPLVGTFYRASAPDAAPFVEVGDQVKTGDVLCIVEAMKSMNEIQSDVSGVVKEICANNAELVEFDQVLFKIEKNG
ncbi:MAG: acetyl-CoA carboxylase biotin carboxyl carrier protein [Candidatus Aminicenantes bacterium]|nr:acetyl-CoA carboxylase biotin carboxyl carrier protein [Candidatus Aminicenantes bacterium]